MPRHTLVVDFAEGVYDLAITMTLLIKEVTLSIRGVIDDRVLATYRELLDAEDAAFYEVEHAYEDGDREHFQADLALWRKAIQAKLKYLDSCGLGAEV